MREWQPLITDRARRSEIASIIREIAAALPPPNTMARYLDRAVLRAYLSQDDTLPDPGDVFASTAVLDELGSTPHGLALFGGACQLGWTVEHIASGDNADRICAVIDRLLLQQFDGAHPASLDYDLIGGLVGSGIYGLERGDAGHEIVGRVIERLACIAQARSGGLAWHTPPERLPSWQREHAPDGYWNLGVAHGIPGVVGLLARCIRHGVHADRARPVLEGAMKFIGATAIASRPDGIVFPAWLPNTKPANVQRRVSWCYGDLGVSIAMLAAAEACDRKDWRELALVIARSCANYNDPTIRDTGICHGAMGAAHLFMRLWNASGDRIFADVATKWIDRAQAMRLPAEGYAGFPCFSDDGWFASDSLLEGEAGVALAFHAAISSVEPTWDRLLLVDF